MTHRVTYENLFQELQRFEQLTHEYETERSISSRGFESIPPEEWGPRWKRAGGQVAREYGWLAEGLLANVTLPLAKIPWKRQREALLTFYSDPENCPFYVAAALLNTMPNGQNGAAVDRAARNEMRAIFGDPSRELAEVVLSGELERLRRHRLSLKADEVLPPGAAASNIEMRAYLARFAGTEFAERVVQLSSELTHPEVDLLKSVGVEDTRRDDIGLDLGR